MKKRQSEITTVAAILGLILLAWGIHEFDSHAGVVNLGYYFTTFLLQLAGIAMILFTARAMSKSFKGDSRDQKMLMSVGAVLIVVISVVFFLLPTVWLWFTRFAVRFAREIHIPANINDRALFVANGWLSLATLCGLLALAGILSSGRRPARAVV